MGFTFAPAYVYKIVGMEIGVDILSWQINLLNQPVFEMLHVVL